MPVICIGPVCIPWTCLPAIVFFVWKFVKPILPEAMAEKIEIWGEKLHLKCKPYLDKLPKMPSFFGKKKKAAETNGSDGANGQAQGDIPSGSVGQIQSAEHLEKLLKEGQANGTAVVLDFTASWCGPCQKIKPSFKKLAAEYPKHCFAEVDADEHQDTIMDTYSVFGLPAFLVLRDGQKVASHQGGEEDKVWELVKSNVEGAESKKST